uniref:Palmitoyltransferase n=1 Tax=Parastrongyloides trichosuri TaxID=131310 RepID=A0A0N4ZJ77_PARTI
MNFFSACYYGPGYLPKGWEPIPSKNKNKLQKCPRCEGYKAPRSHHCRKCNACCMKMDHHCPYINNCLGFSNHKFFLLFMIYAIVGCFYSVCISSVYLYDAYIILTADDDFIFDQHSFTHLSFSNVACAISNFGLALAVDIALSILLFVQMKAVITNKTQIENFICAKMFHSETLNENEKQSYPYDLGWKENLKQVFCHGLKPKGNGIWYDTIKGTDNFTLSVIQKMLKAEKASCSRKYRIITSQLESYGIIKCCINYGIRVAWSKPCFNDEPFLPVNVGEVYLVNRGNKEWIYGERIVSMSNSSTETKGWFPRRLAKVVLEEVSSNSEDESTNTE